jgi:hypothetical protein
MSKPRLKRNTYLRNNIIMDHIKEALAYARRGSTQHRILLALEELGPRNANAVLGERAALGGTAVLRWLDTTLEEIEAGHIVKAAPEPEPEPDPEPAPDTFTTLRGVPVSNILGKHFVELTDVNALLAEVEERVWLAQNRSMPAGVAFRVDRVALAKTHAGVRLELLLLPKDKDTNALYERLSPGNIVTVAGGDLP